MWIHSAGAQYGVDNVTIHAAPPPASQPDKNTHHIHTHESESAERDSTKEKWHAKIGHKGCNLSGNMS